jgi:hypothetical protein
VACSEEVETWQEFAIDPIKWCILLQPDLFEMALLGAVNASHLELN